MQMKKTALVRIFLPCIAILLIAAPAFNTAALACGHGGYTDRSTAADLLALDVGPVAIGHRGLGPNLGEDPAMPIENTVKSVKAAYKKGALVVEVDVQLTRDNRLVVFHDDFLDDFTCIRSLTLKQLKARLPYVPELRDILDVAHFYNKKAAPDLGGILIIELKSFAPMCDPQDVYEQPLVDAVVKEVRKAQMSEQVIFDSFSPSLLYLASQAAPEIARELDINGLQLLTPEQVAAGNRPARNGDRQEELARTHLGRHRPHLPAAGLFLDRAVPRYRSRHTGPGSGGGNEFSGTGRAAAARRRHSIRERGTWARSESLRRPCRHGSGVGLFRIPRCRCNLHYYPAGPAAAADNSQLGVPRELSRIR